MSYLKPRRRPLLDPLLSRGHWVQQPRDRMVVDHQLEAALLPAALHVADVEGGGVLVGVVVLGQPDVVVGVAQAVVVESGLEGVAEPEK